MIRAYEMFLEPCLQRNNDLFTTQIEGTHPERRLKQKPRKILTILAENNIYTLHMNETKSSNDLEFNVGKQIREIRTRLGLSIRDLAARVGISYLTMQRIETDKLSPSVVLLAQISACLNYPMADFLLEKERSVIHRSGKPKHSQNKENGIESGCPQRNRE